MFPPRRLPPAPASTVTRAVAHRTRSSTSVRACSTNDAPCLDSSVPTSRSRTWEHIDGRLTMIDHDGSIVLNQFDPADYRDHLGEAGKSDSYLKSPYYRPRVTGDDPRPGMYRVGPLARINIAERFGTPIADQGLAEFRERYGRIASSAFLYHHARVLEVIACAERIAALMDDPVLLDTRVRAQAGINANRGVGASEAPRGTLVNSFPFKPVASIL